ncbi:protein-cysteine N-palmitoyltransferase HHAT-like [Varroa jacobsoni]|uniref:Uncharacterized protein n=1 Tax=Varroa destructor TaxID=109461 RepID=A0A7M7MF19_VARDE|nr:protein-cysteine N-palmitoyltransferase HHAT-like [Varroa destructor]XP_022657082.1 protein-cysteine N-palmitoyltransferase HHAT-like [Varroa destructor]XP_022697214.1 protein-cysteine N-palmitoyltransferase HHAT-like [Varroa jacobsoni]XP_022697215.1 protein-cysteine N-palmitoyltransferase HHAT-like [Varroa jacobsoni]
MGKTAILIISMFVWSWANLFALFQFGVAVLINFRHLLPDDLFQAGWLPALTEADISDPEWLSVKFLANFYLPAIVVQNLILRCTPNTLHVQLRCLIALTFLGTTFGPVCTYLLLGLFGLTYAASKLRRKYAIYIVNLFIVYLVIYKRELLDNLVTPTAENESIDLMFDIAASWACLRAISLGLALIDGDVDVIYAFCYYMYLPSLCAGPLINCKSFTQQLDRSRLPSRVTAIKQAMSSALKLAIWVLFIELVDHTLFVSAMVTAYSNVRFHLTTLEYFGLCVAMMARFYVKYLVIYGVGEAAARLEGIWLPERPRCTLRVTSGSHLWRTFDRGLYLWFVEYIYVPLGGQIYASAACFFFACFWHSFSSSIQVWATVNCAIVVTERSLSKSLSPTVWAFSQIPLHWLAVGSNMFYLGDLDVGNDFFHYLSSSALVIAVACVISLCACVVGNHFEKEDNALFNTKKSTVIYNKRNTF